MIFKLIYDTVYVMIDYILKYNIIFHSVAAAAQTRFTMLCFLVYLQVSTFLFTYLAAALRRCTALEGFDSLKSLPVSAHARFSLA